MSKTMIESMRWTVGVGPGETQQYANRVVAWVNANGGEAWYGEPGLYGRSACIVIRVAGRDLYATPGQRVVMGDLFPQWEPCGIAQLTREFIVAD